MLLSASAALSACQRGGEATLTVAPFDADSGSIRVRCGALIDGLADEVMADKTVVIQDGRIAAVADSGAETAQTLPLLDLSAYTCLPGLINTHVHFDLLPEDAVDYGIYTRRTVDDNLELVLGNAATTLQTGFTTVRHVGAWFPNAVYAGRDRIRAGLAPGPRIQTAGPYLTIPAGGGDLTFPEIPPEKIPAESQTGIATTPDEFRQRAITAVAGGADFLKVIASGAVFSVGIEPGLPEMHQDDIEAVVEVARENGLKVAAHVHSDQSGRDAILAGVDILEHASLLEDDTIALALEHGVALSMDVYNGTYTDTVGRAQGYPEEFLRRNTDTTEAQRAVFKKAHALGVPITYGTDAGVLPHDMGGWQFEIMVELGMRPIEAIRSATSVAAEQMGMADDVGAIKAGRYGDLIAVKGKPLEDALLFRNVAVVIKGGLIFKLDTDR